MGLGLALAVRLQQLQKQLLDGHEVQEGAVEGRPLATDVAQLQDAHHRQAPGHEGPHAQQLSLVHLGEDAQHGGAIQSAWRCQRFSRVTLEEVRAALLQQR